MAFQLEQSIVPDRRGAVSILFYIPDPDNAEETQYGNLGVQIKYTDGSLKEKKFDLLERLQDDVEGQQHLANLVALKIYLINRIESELLP